MAESCFFLDLDRSHSNKQKPDSPKFAPGTGPYERTKKGN